MLRISHTVALLGLTLSASAVMGEVKRQEIGTLTCTTEDMIATPPATARPMQCRFEPSKKGTAVNFKGMIHTFTVDGLPPGRQVLVWAVLASSAQLAGEALEGRYTEAKETEPHVGKMLVGGAKGDIALQSHTPNTEVGVSAVKTVVDLELAPIRT